MSVSWGVWRCLLAFVGMSCSLEMSGGCLGSVWAPDSGGISEWYSWKLEALGCGRSGTTLKVVCIGLFGCLGVSDVVSKI